MIKSKINLDLETNLISDLTKSSQSILMQDISYKVLQLAKRDSNVIIVGEIGSGKKRLAEVIHENSSRKDKPFHSFYCLNINEDEYKDAFWGHLEFNQSGITVRYDALEKATAGTLHLDQFSELSETFMLNIINSFRNGCHQLFRFKKSSQPRLLLSINEEAYHTIIHSNIWQIILDQLDPVVIMLPPLRERKEDIPVLIKLFVNEIKKSSQYFENLNISSQALYACFNYQWPGNIRQLKNAILQGAILSYGKTIELDHLPFTMSWKLPYKLDEK
ncbi:sigma 54-interacting transcriptional regulator [Fodinibius saliphilus]|uniref:sigma 54-interacting transcriptional regulator n=1 Tax=Fodinibius saliphilus TaxID=1920650 RepID=UPI00110976FA|nr:sigma 54-interacting transcriptional regulator [Fodinibius saliphilus]